MIVLLLVLIIAILLFGAAAVKGVLNGFLVFVFLAVIMVLSIAAYDQYPTFVEWGLKGLGAAAVCFFLWLVTDRLMSPARMRRRLAEKLAEGRAIIEAAETRGENEAIEAARTRGEDPAIIEAAMRTLERNRRRSPGD